MCVMRVRAENVPVRVVLVGEQGAVEDEGLAQEPEGVIADFPEESAGESGEVVSARLDHDPVGVGGEAVPG